jgi:hypothetical protein
LLEIYDRPANAIYTIHGVHESDPAAQMGSSSYAAATLPLFHELQ